MKKILFILLAMTSLSTFAQQATVSLSNIFDTIQKERFRPSTDAKFVKKLEGTWYSTFRQPQVYPAGCSLNKFDRVVPDQREISLSLYEPLRVFGVFKTVAGKLRWNGTHAVEFEGNTLVDGDKSEVNCSIRRMSEINGDVLTCFKPFYDNGNCGWYSFYIKAD